MLQMFEKSLIKSADKWFKEDKNSSKKDQHQNNSKSNSSGGTGKK